MESFIITIIAAVLYFANIITAQWFLGITIASLVWLFVGSALYFKFGFLKCFYHDLLGWHTPDNSPQWHDGCSEHATCKHCGKDIMQDSQGNWFC